MLHLYLRQRRRYSIKFNEGGEIDTILAACLSETSYPLLAPIWLSVVTVHIDLTKKGDEVCPRLTVYPAASSSR
jgi:hypothetical protein